MNANLERFERSPEKTDYTTTLKVNLAGVFMELFLHPEDVPEADKEVAPIVIRGHHVKHPFLSFLYEYPLVLDELGAEPLDFAKHPEFVNFIINRSISDAYAIANSQMHSDYIKDVLGEKEEELKSRVVKTIKMYKTILTGDPNRKVILSVDKNDILCDACVTGEHCAIGRNEPGKPRIWINNMIDAIFVTQLTEEAENPTNVIKEEQKKKEGQREFYVVESELTLGDFRQALKKYFPKKKHIFEPDPED